MVKPGDTVTVETAPGIYATGTVIEILGTVIAVSDGYGVHGYSLSQVVKL